ncbi:hypothetical protein PILCRDRAFT_125852 [Piloderma croceum F 1598]|uniref:Uncharacterized protein n=1 Tax=Piloderma croceum (strain F 1598) TaxID=765440 RepID=A0A0C3GL53_PILCF|nr:hypothetical protein PILCRDRAFT_125852 [Piloderma croceum F 1598]
MGKQGGCYHVRLQTSRPPEACQLICLASSRRVPCQATATFIEALPCLSTALIHFLSLTGEDALANLTVLHVGSCSDP